MVYIKDFYVSIIYKIENNTIKDFYGTIKYKIEGSLSSLEIMALIAILYAR